MKMRILAAALVSVCALNAQVYLNVEANVLVNIMEVSGPEVACKKGDNLEIIVINKNIVQARKKGEEKVISFKSSNLDKLSIQYTTLDGFWKSKAIMSGAYSTIAEKGMQYDLRKELEEDALEYHSYLVNNGLLFSDEYLETHLYSLVLEVIPQNRTDGLPGIISISIVTDPLPNAYILPNGSMYLTTGLLSTINSDAELQAILTHEAAHFMLDHQVENINAAQKRKQNAEFWAAFATGVAAVTDVYMASNNDYYIPGVLTASTAVLSFTLADAIGDQMGLKYSRDQEMEADLCARDLLRFLGKKPEALSTALSKIKAYAIRNGDYSIISEGGTHPNVDVRIDSIGAPIQISDPKYDVRLSMINTYNAIMEYNSRRFESCAALAQRNINAGVPTEDDYLLMAMTNLFRFNTLEKNQEAFELVQKAKALNIVPTINLYKQEALTLIRLGRLTEAKASLQAYLASVQKENDRMKEVLNPGEWSRINRYLVDEYKWTKKMINKVEKL